MKTLHVDDFAALNEEIRALAAAGIPLPEGLRAAGAEYPGRVGNAANAIANRLESGEPLEKALVAECGLNDTYAMIVSAGVRSGKLTQALEGVVDSARRISALRRLILVSLTYPVILITLAYGLFVFLLGRREFFVADYYQTFDLGASPFGFYSTLYDTLAYWAWIPPVLFVLLIIVGVTMIGRGGTVARFRLPVIQQLVQFGRIASFLELLRLLIEHQTPLDDACELAARASADEGIKASGESLATKIRSGVRSASRTGNQIPPMIQWLILSGAPQKTLVANLRRSAQSYSRRVERLSAWMNVYIPLVFGFVLGGGATAVFGFLVLGPWFHFLLRLGASV